MIIAICTPLMSCVHQMVQQEVEMVFCDSTSTIDHFGTSLFASHACGGLPLGVFIVSDEQEETIVQELQLLQSVLPEDAFHNHGVKNGSLIVMTDDSIMLYNRYGQMHDCCYVDFIFCKPDGLSCTTHQSNC